MRASIRRVGGVVAGVALVTGALAAPAQAEPASLSGTLTSEATGEPIFGCVYAYTADAWEWAGGMCTDESGQWLIDGLETGVGYKVEFNPNDRIYRNEWADDAADFDSATVHTAPATVDAALAYSREVGDEIMTGAITAAETGEALPGCARLYDAETHDFVDSSCSEDGHWWIERLAARPYKVYVDTWDGIHVGEYAYDASSLDEATPVTAPAHVETALDPGAVLEGTLSRADGQPAESAEVSIHDAADSDDVAAYATTDSDGTWRAVVPAGDYKVRFDHWLGEPYVVTQWAVGHEREEDADVVTAAVGEPVRVDDQILGRVSVSGTVIGDSTGEGVPGACVTVRTRESYPDGEAAGYGCADPTGYFSFDLSTTGEFIAEFTDESGDFLGEFTGDTRDIAGATTFEATRESPAVLSASLADAAWITGRAVDARTGAPLENVCPIAYLGHAGDHVPTARTCSGPDGRWRVGGLDSGSYALLFNPTWNNDHHVWTWAFKGTSQATADLITVAAGQRKTVRDVKLGLGGTVSGRITDPTGQPVVGAWVDLDGNAAGRAGPGEGLLTAQTDENGDYVVNGVPAGDYTPIAYGDTDGPWAPEWSGNATLKSLGEPLTVKTAKTTRFSAELAPAAGVTGTVLDAAGEVVQDYWMGDIVGADGRRVGIFDVYNGSPFRSSALPAGTFTLRLENVETGEVVWFDGATSQQDAQRVTLAEGELREITVHLP